MEITKQNIEKYAIEENDYFGDKLLKHMGYDATCISFCKCNNRDYYNIAWMLESGETYIKSFHISELLK